MFQQIIYLMVHLYFCVNHQNQEEGKLVNTRGAEQPRSRGQDLFPLRPLMMSQMQGLS